MRLVESSFANKVHKNQVRCANELRMQEESMDVVVASLSPFYATKAMFRRYLRYAKPLTYVEWMSISDSDKAAALYVQFFDQITLAWNKTKSFYALEEDGVSTMMQYLEKNVPLIMSAKSKFSAPYIYKVAYNCLYCISHDIKRDRDRYELECSNVVVSGEDELDLFDTVPSSSDYEEEMIRQEFWAVIEDMDVTTLELVEKLINAGKAPARMGPKQKACLDALREKLEKFSGVIY